MSAWSTLPADHESSLSHPGPLSNPLACAADAITSGPIKTANILWAKLYAPNRFRHVGFSPFVVVYGIAVLTFFQVWSGSNQFMRFTSDIV
jgi:hypothetical protein